MKIKFEVELDTAADAEDQELVIQLLELVELIKSMKDL